MNRDQALAIVEDALADRAAYQDGKVFKNPVHSRVLMVL
jgi:hypothetical protein